VNLGSLYGKLKLNILIEGLNNNNFVEVDTNRILLYIQYILRAESLIFQEKDEIKGQVINDIGSNVWFFNEYLVPQILIKSSRNIGFEDFGGCDFLYLKQYKLLN
jgi:hypothetical protein